MIDDIAIGELPSEEDLLLCFHQSEDLFALPYDESSNSQPSKFEISNESYVLTTFNNNGSLGLMPKLAMPSLYGDLADRNFAPVSSSKRPRVFHGTRLVHQTNRNKIQSISQPKQKSFRGVSRHRLTQRWEASLWLHGKQLYLGGFNVQQDAAKAYDIAALACKGSKAITNFPREEYNQQLEELSGHTEEEVVAYIRRRSTAFSRGRSKYRGVSGQVGRWEARIGSFGGRKNVWLFMLSDPRMI